MRKTILLLAGLTIMSCSESGSSNKQEEVAKQELLKMNVKEYELEKYTFSTTEIFDKDAYGMISRKYTDNAERFTKLEDLANAETEYNKATEYLERETTGKTFYKVDAIRMAGTDTLNIKKIYIDDQNKVIDTYNIR